MADSKHEHEEAGKSGLREARFRHSPSFAKVLGQMRCSLLVSTYQAGQLVAIGLGESGNVDFSFHQFDQAMGVAARPRQLAVGARGQVWYLDDNSPLASRIEPAGRFDRCYLTRSAHVTGAIHCHELAWGTGGGGQPELWVVNTLFSCLVNLHPDYNFVPRWRPPFVSALAAEDRCHLNGLAMRDGRPAFVTVMAQTDEPGAWREDKNNTGTILDVATGEPVTTGLAMPHSPRLHEGRLLVLDSGRGRLDAVDLNSGEREQVEAVPGYARGLACHGNLAFVGLSRIREQHVFGGVPIAERHNELKCGVAVIDLHSGNTVATLEFESGVEEIFDVQVLPETRCVALSGHRPAEGEDAQEIWVVPEPGQVPAGPDPSASAPGGGAATPAPDGRPRTARELNELGNRLQESDNQPSAIAAYQQATRRDPSFAPAFQNLGYLLVSQGRTQEGIAKLRRAQEIEPRDVNRVMIATALPVIYPSLGDVAEIRAQLISGVADLVGDGVAIDTTDALIPTGFFTAYQGENDRILNENLGRIYRGPDLVGDRPAAPGGRARIGFLSAYFRDHTIGRLNLGRLQRLDRERFEVVVFSVGNHADAMAAAYEQAADEYVRVPREVAKARELIAARDLDLLLFTDVGMDALTYTLAFSRMAPVQATSWGHPVTTGSEHMDYFISSELLEIEGAEDHYSEELIRLPSLGTYYDRPPQPGADGLREMFSFAEDAHIYACPQTLFKLHPEFDQILAGILRADPAAELILLEGRVEKWTELLQERFERTMPDVVERIGWLPPLPRPDFLGLLAAADVALDPIPFGGGNTTYESLAVGTPVVTMPGELLRGRIAGALYAKAGFTDLVAGSPEEYVEIAVRLGTDADHRSGVRERIAESCGVLFEDEGEVRDLEAALDAMIG